MSDIIVNDITKELQIKIKTLFNSFENMENECIGIYDAYWDTDANTQVSGLSSDSDPATLSTKLTKKNYQDGITFCQQLNNFFTNLAVTQADYLGTVNTIRYADAVSPTKLSEATEQIGERILQICLDALEIFNQAKKIINQYYDNEVSDMVGVFNSERMIPGSSMTKQELASAIILLEEFKDLISNGTVTTADYSATIANWARFELTSE